MDTSEQYPGQKNSATSSSLDIAVNNDMRRNNEGIFDDQGTMRSCASIRVNTLKMSVQNLCKILSKDWILTPIPWCAQGFWIRSINKDRAHAMDLAEYKQGYFCMQEAAAMVPPIALDAQEDEQILLLQVTPASIIHISDMMKNTGKIITQTLTGCVDVVRSELERAGVANTTIVADVTRENNADVTLFDRVYLERTVDESDALSASTPHSSNQEITAQHSAMQHALLETAYANLRIGGVLVFSNGSMHPAENEAAIDWFLRTHPDMNMLPCRPTGLHTSPAILRAGDQDYHLPVEECLRMYPQDNNTQGLFLAKMMKTAMTCQDH